MKKLCPYCKHNKFEFFALSPFGPIFGDIYICKNCRREILEEFMENERTGG